MVTKRLSKSCPNCGCLRIRRRTLSKPQQKYYCEACKRAFQFPVIVEASRHS